MTDVQKPTKDHPSSFSPDNRDIETVARAMHEALCGSWEAAGFEVKDSFLNAAMKALEFLHGDGWDLFSYPDGGWSKETAL